jgi:hypothetical protein
MSDIQDEFGPIKFGPVVSWDNVRVKIEGRQWPTRWERRFLQENCKNEEPIKAVPVERSYGKFQKRWLNLNLVAPNEEAIAAFGEDGLLGRFDHTVSCAERALNLVTETQRDAERLYRYFKRHLVIPNVRKTNRWKGREIPGYREFKGTLYIGNPNGFEVVIYADKPCKLTGRPCLHIEHRYHSSTTVRKKPGVNQMTDLLAVNEPMRMDLFQIDVARLGQWKENSKTGTRRRKVGTDGRLGQLVYGNSRSLQELVLRVGRGAFLERINVKLGLERSYGRDEWDQRVARELEKDHEMVNIEGVPQFKNRADEIEFPDVPYVGE